MALETRLRQLGSFGSGAGIGLPIIGGTPGSILFVDALGNIGQDNSNFFWDATNHFLGIGTNSPLYPIDVQVGVTPIIRAYGSGNPDFLAESSTNSVQMKIQALGGNSVGLVGTQSAHDLTFYVGNVEKMRLDTSGRLGLGRSPTQHLDSYSGSTTLNALFESTGNTYIDIKGQSSHEVGLGCDITSNFSDFVGSISNTNFSIRTNNTTRVTIDTSGNVGIGTTPNYPLTVAASGTGGIQVTGTAASIIDIPSASTTNGWITTNGGARSLLAGDSTGAYLNVTSSAGGKFKFVTGGSTASPILMQLQNTGQLNLLNWTLGGSSATDNVFNITGTFPTTLTAEIRGMYFAFTTAGSSNQPIMGYRCDLLAGWTGNHQCAAVYGNNSVAGTGASYLASSGNIPYTPFKGNFGSIFVGNAATSGIVLGTTALAGGSSTANYAAWNSATASNNSPALNVGTLGFALNATTNVAGFFALADYGTNAPTFSSAALICDNGSTASPIFVARVNATDSLVVNSAGTVSKYKGISTAAWGIPAIYGRGRSTGQTGAAASVATYTVGATTGAFLISSNVNVTASTTHNFTGICNYTDETNTARTFTFSYSQIGGTIINSITNVTGTGPYEGIPVHIVAQSSTTITIATTGTFTTVTYNVEGNITQIA